MYFVFTVNGEKEMKRNYQTWKKRNDPTWQPSPKNVEILKLAMKHVKSVPYKVSLRWLFYRLLQDGIYKSKNDYHYKFKDIMSRARHTRYNGWSPDTLADDSRNIVYRGFGAFDEKEAIEDIDCNLDKFLNQEYVLMLLYEANAMTGQFKQHTAYIPLVPFGGDPSLPYKWETAMVVKEAYERYEKPVVLLYFGDCDKKGNEIHKTAIEDITNWCPVEFEVVYCGLTEKQAIKYNLPENPDKPGQYQWEALTDEQAREIILSNVLRYQDYFKLKEALEEEKEIVERWKGKLKEE